MKLFPNFNKIARYQIVDYVRETLTKIDVSSGKCRLNQRCHMNSVHEAMDNGEKEIAICI